MLFDDDETRRIPKGEPEGDLLSEGECFGRYRIVRLLGRGGMGEVYEVKHRDLRTRHAIKLIKPEIVDQPPVRERFKREARFMARLRHPNIVHVDDVGQLDGRIWLRMDLIPGWEYEGQHFLSLQDLMDKKGSLPEGLVKGLLEAILRGLSSAHDLGGVHRDIKPSNILFDAAGGLKISDFGLVHIVGEDWLKSQAQQSMGRSPADTDKTHLKGEGSESEGSSAQALLGTYAYMSPEQKKGAEVDARSDLYSVGLIGFRMLTGEESLGFELPTDLTDGIDPRWDKWVKRAVATKPERRFSSAEEMLEGLPGFNERGILKVSLPGGEVLRMVWIEPGTFMMGSPESEEGRFGDEKQHRVTLSEGYWLGETEVTQGQWSALMGSNPSYFKGSDHPVEGVSWKDAMEFCRKLTSRERAAGRLPKGYVYNLPSEAQWEYACRAGTSGPYAGSLDTMAWYEDNSGSETHPVGEKAANAWGLYDMHGNVWEWCLDRYGDYPDGSVVDPAGAATGSSRVNRGGCWGNFARFCRSAYRYRNGPDDRYFDLGFRLALSVNR